MLWYQIRPHNKQHCVGLSMYLHKKTAKNTMVLVLWITVMYIRECLRSIPWESYTLFMMPYYKKGSILNVTSLLNMEQIVKWLLHSIFWNNSRNDGSYHFFKLCAWNFKIRHWNIYKTICKNVGLKCLW